ncbi:DUF655 domain-containing protein [Candidatus Hodarchaeum mangrovi]
MKQRDIKPKRENRDLKPRFEDLGTAIVIDFYPQGKSLSRRRSEDFNPLAVVITSQWFEFFDVTMTAGTGLKVNDAIMISPKNKRIIKVNQTSLNQISNSASSILTQVITEIIKNSEKRFIQFLNQAHPLTTQMHQLQLLPGIGNKRLWAILDTRKKAPFESFEDFSIRTGISDPISLFANRILSELDGSPKYFLFVKKRKTLDEV